MNSVRMTNNSKLSQKFNTSIYVVLIDLGNLLLKIFSDKVYLFFVCLGMKVDKGELVL